jgi:demethylmenaquinone methyltransferase/2-methoxy-6-polyprenyl-1,4-benzoquinol methylase
VPFEDSTLGKKQQVSDMFNRIAFRYDFLNRLLSGGADLYWRKKAIRELASVQPESILDVATGTADMAIMMTKYLSPKQIIGIDISEGMLGLGRKKIANLKLQDKILLQAGDSEAINFPDNTFDAITVAFGVRNFENLEKGMKEMKRVLKSGGKLVVLEFSKPKQGLFGKLCRFYMGFIAPGLVQLFSKKQAYQYLNKSVQAFPEGDAFINIMREAGFHQTYYKPLSLGICTIYVGENELA